MTKIKICGLSRTEDIEFVNEALPDYIGFVFAKSKRQLTFEKAKQLKAMLNPKIKAVGVFVNEPIDNIIILCKLNVIDIIQLHGEEDAEYIKKLSISLQNPIIKAARVKSENDIVRAEEYNTDYILLDAYKEGEYGGSGNSFDWEMIHHVQKPFFLAGGVNPQNVIEAIKAAKPYGIDVSSGVETDGIKDRNKIMDIITKVRSV